jgi:hypothetical protein
MNRNVLCVSALGILLVSLIALPVAAQTIPPGRDYWVTPANGRTYFTFPDGDVESLCGAPPSSAWDHKLVLQGVPAAGSDYDTVVARLDKIVFDANRQASTRIQVELLKFTGTATQSTPCGPLDWTASLAGQQAVTVMKLRRTTPRGGLFSADIAVSVELRASQKGRLVGSLFYNIILPDPQTGTPWSLGPSGQFRAGMTVSHNCVDVLRQKLLQFPTDSSHFYFISNLIAQGKCREQ